METCKVCKIEFEPWMSEFECNNCEDGMEEVWYDWCFDEPEYRTCSTCHGNETYNFIERAFCSEDCREDYFNPYSPYNEKMKF